MPSQKSKNRTPQTSDASLCQLCMWLTTRAEPVPPHSAQRGNLGHPSITHPVTLMLLTGKLVWLVAAQQLQEQAFQKYRFLGRVPEVNPFLHIPPYGGLDPQPGWKPSATGPPFRSPPSGPHVTCCFTARLSHPCLSPIHSSALSDLYHHRQTGPRGGSTRISMWMTLRAPPVLGLLTPSNPGKHSWSPFYLSSPPCL